MLCKVIRNWLICVAGAVVLMPSQTIASDVVLTIEAQEYSSCPMVYTWNGEEYQLENDIYSVGRGEQKEFTDYLNILNSVLPKDGVYSFELREVTGETSWTDSFKIIAVDHPADVRVGVDSSGNVHSYETPASPVSAVDEKGVDVLASIAAQDDNTLDMYHNSTVELDFSSVDISAGAKLVMDLNGFEGEVGGGFIPATPAIQIQTIEAGEWVTRHSFFPKQEWTIGVFDLKPYLTESQVVRLVGISCFGNKYHLIDYVGLDNTPDRISRAEVLEPQTALLNGTADVLYEISDSDDTYVNTVPEDVITITFPYNEPAAGESRSLAVISEGYYLPVENTYYVYTWDGSTWVERYASAWPDFDSIQEVTLSSYLPDSDGEYKVRLLNSLTSSWGGDMWAYVDYINLSVDGISHNPSYAQQESPELDILASVSASDDFRWYSENKSAIIKFSTPLADPGGPYSGYRGSPVVFDGTGSSDLDGDSLQYDWDFGDGSSVAVDAGPTPGHIYSSIGTYTVCLTVTDSDGNSGTACTTDGTPPQAEPLSVTFETLSTDCTGNPVPLQLFLNEQLIGEEVSPEYNCTCTPGVNTVTIPDTTFTDFFNIGGENTWDFFKASQSSNYVSWAKVIFDYGDGQTQEECLFDYNGGNCDVTDLCSADFTDSEISGQYVAAVVPSTNVTILNRPPVADAGPDQSAIQDDQVCFDGSGSSDADDDPLTYSWIFTAWPAGSMAEFDDSTSDKPCFTAELPGTYKVSLIVNDGIVDSAPSTAEAVVISYREAIDQLCPCDGPEGTGDTWKNHGQYVSCVAKSAESFLEAGRITEAEKDAIVSDAAQSDCGDK